MINMKSWNDKKFKKTFVNKLFLMTLNYVKEILVFEIMSGKW